MTKIAVYRLSSVNGKIGLVVARSTLCHDASLSDLKALLMVILFSMPVDSGS